MRTLAVLFSSIGLIVLAGCGQDAKPAAPPSAKPAMPVADTAKAEPEIPLKPEVYPQDTPQNAAGSIVKALEAADYAYFARWLLVPEGRDRLLTKWKSFANYEAEKKKPEIRGAMDDLARKMKEVISKSPVLEGEQDGVKWVHLETPGVLGIHLELRDGRWALNQNPPPIKPKN
jgi:hypothetical protein